MNDNSFEKFPGSRVEVGSERVLSENEDFGKSFESGVPEFAGDKFGVANENNEYYGEGQDGEGEFDDGMANAASLINYGLNAAARELGVEQVVQRVKDFDTTGSANPIGDLYDHLGVNSKEEWKNLRDESDAAMAQEVGFRSEAGMPEATKKSYEGALSAINSMKGLIAEVEGANPKYEKIREGAKAAGMGYFEYAVKDYGVRGLTELFEVLSRQTGEDGEGKFRGGEELEDEKLTDGEEDSEDGKVSENKEASENREASKNEDVVEDKKASVAEDVIGGEELVARDATVSEKAPVVEEAVNRLREGVINQENMSEQEKEILEEALYLRKGNKNDIENGRGV